MNSVILAGIVYGFIFIECAHIVKIEKDFNKVLHDKVLEKSVDEVVDKLKSFQLPMHPRIAAIYQILQKGMKLFAEQHAESLYMPDTYVVNVDNALDKSVVKANDNKAQTDATTTKAAPQPVTKPTTKRHPGLREETASSPTLQRRTLDNRHPVYDEFMDK